MSTATGCSVLVLLHVCTHADRDRGGGHNILLLLCVLAHRLTKREHYISPYLQLLVYARVQVMNQTGLVVRQPVVNREPGSNHCQIFFIKRLWVMAWGHCLNISGDFDPCIYWDMKVAHTRVHLKASAACLSGDDSVALGSLRLSPTSWDLITYQDFSGDNLVLNSLENNCTLTGLTVTEHFISPICLLFFLAWQMVQERCMVWIYHHTWWRQLHRDYASQYATTSWSWRLVVWRPFPMIMTHLIASSTATATTSGPACNRHCRNFAEWWNLVLWWWRFSTWTALNWHSHGAFWNMATLTLSITCVL